MRYEGMKYKHIVEQLEKEFKLKQPIKEATVKFWFSNHGRLSDVYLDYMKKENERRRRLVHHELQKVVQLLPNKIHSLMTRKDKDGKEKLDKVTLGTVKTILDTLGFKMEPTDETEDPVDRYFDRAEEEIKNEDDRESIKQDD